MPSIPPTAVKSTEDIDKKLSPHRVGIKLPIVEPIAIKIQIIDFVFINLYLTSLKRIIGN